MSFQPRGLARIYALVLDRLSPATARVHRWGEALDSVSEYRVFAAVFSVLVLYRLAFVITYPLNLAGDGENYLRMIVDRVSSLAHPGGYPFVMNALLIWHSDAYPPSVSLIYALQIIHHSLELITLAVLFFCLSEIFNKWVAALALVFVGMDLDALAFTNLATPEWLQADLLVLSLCAAYRGYAAGTDRSKALFYSISSALFILCWLVKFNALVFVFSFIPIYFFERSARRKWIALTAVVSGAAVYAIFMVTYHYPTVRDKSLTADTGWVLMAKLDIVFGDKIFENAGLEAKKLMALDAVLPRMTPSQAFPMYSRIDAVPAEVRKPYRDRYLWILDTSEVDWFLSRYPFPKDIRVSDAFAPVAYYIGLAESETLVHRIFLEVVNKNRKPYFRYCLRSFNEFFATYPQEFWRSQGILLPVTGGSGVVSRTGGGKGFHDLLAEQQDLGFGFARLELDPQVRKGRHYDSGQYFSFQNIFWKPGVRVFGLASRIMLPQGVLVLVLGVLALRAIRLWSRKGLTPETVVVLFLFVAIPGFVAYSELIFFLRDKELRLIWPLVGTAYAVAAWWICTLVGHIAGVKNAGSVKAASPRPSRP